MSDKVHLNKYVCVCVCVCVCVDRKKNDSNESKLNLERFYLFGINTSTTRKKEEGVKFFGQHVKQMLINKKRLN